METDDKLNLNPEDKIINKVDGVASKQENVLKCGELIVCNKQTPLQQIKTINKLLQSKNTRKYLGVQEFKKSIMQGVG